MKNQQYDEQDNQQFNEYIGLGNRKAKLSKNQQIYGDFYEAYEQQRPMMKKVTRMRPEYDTQSAFSNFKIGSKIENYTAESDIHIPEPKKKIKFEKSTIEQDQQDDKPVIGKFNLKSFLQEYQQNQLQEIEQQNEDQSSSQLPQCLNDNIKLKMKLLKFDQQSDQQYDSQDVNGMTFEQYKKIAFKKSEQKPKKRLTLEEKQIEKQHINDYGIGYKMAEKMGFNVGKGLGKNQQGISKPVEAVFKKAFTAKDTKKVESEEESKPQQNLAPPQEQLFQYRSKNRNINNFLIDIKNKFQSLKSKMFFYQREIKNFEGDFEIDNSLKLQKQNQFDNLEDQVKKLVSIMNYGKNIQNIKNDDKLSGSFIKKQGLKNLYPHLSLQYKMDILYVKNFFLRIKQLKDNQIWDRFPGMIQELKEFLFNFYLQKQKQTIKGYQQGIRTLKDKTKVINLEEEIIDLVDEGPTETQAVATVSFEDQQKIINFIEIVAENTILNKISEELAKYKNVGQIKNFKILECIRSLKTLNKNSELVDNLVKKYIKPLLFNYYEYFEFEQIRQEKKTDQNEEISFSTKGSNQKQKILPHLIIFPLFEIMGPQQMEIGKLFLVLSKKLWSIKYLTLYNIIRPLLQFCTKSQSSNFINFFLSPRILYELQEFDLTQPTLCKQLMTGFKKYKQFLNDKIKEDILDNTIIPELVMTYKKYEKEGMGKMDLNNWMKRWVKQIDKILPRYLEDTLKNDFDIQL